METIYIDVLVTLNIYVTFLLIKATAALSHKVTRRAKTTAACVLGGLCSLTVLLPPLIPPVSVVFKLVSGAIIVAVCFDDDTPRSYFRTLVTFFLVSAVFGGIIMMLWLFGKGVSFHGGALYIDVSFVTIVAASSLAYGGIKLIQHFFTGKHSDKVYEIKIAYKCGTSEETKTLRGFADSGNNVTDLFTGKPVILLSKHAGAGVTPSNIPRPLPVKTALSTGLIDIFRVESATVDGRPAEVMLGISEQDFEDGIDAVFNPKIITH
ncbi:hypothetical protein FACS1894120_2510 [Clostridia bacterium]|nr:hypothetical protein FACS1894120_2510 [Clostridia bacterium]